LKQTLAKPNHAQLTVQQATGALGARAARAAVMEAKDGRNQLFGVSRMEENRVR
jgi:hypothetical protein